MLVSRCVRAFASSSVRPPSKNYVGPLSLSDHPILRGLEAAQPNLSDRPPVGTDYGPPRGPPQSKNPLDQADLAKYREIKPRYSLYCQSTRNNTITTLMDEHFKPVAAFSGGSVGFKKVNRSGYEAGYQCAVHMFKAIEASAQKKDFVIDLYFKGFGQGRDAMHRALLTSEGESVRPLVGTITDRTPIKIGGTRAKKARRFRFYISAMLWNLDLVKVIKYI
ncbi:hypothetical protein DXG01_007878 [Tephrocybe rancida]|nr:hypothetical protein DXG01_007878 [Tephrocybe rancida]